MNGQLKIDEKKIHEKNSDDLRDKISYVSQNFFRGYDFIRTNICGSNHANYLDEVKEASKLAEIHDFIESLQTSIIQNLETLV